MAAVGGAAAAAAAAVISGELTEAVQEKDLERVGRILTQPGANPNLPDEEGIPPLFHAVSGNDAQMVGALLAHRLCDPNIATPDGNSPLLLAASKGQGGVLKRLLADPRIQPNITPPQSEGDDAPVPAGLNIRRDFHPYTPLAVAAAKGKSVAMRRLLSHPRTDPNVTNPKRKTLLHLLQAEEDERGRALLLTDPRVDVNVQDHKGNTPLHKVILCLETYRQITDKRRIRSLLSHPNINPNLPNNEGRVPLQCAIKKECINSVRLLLDCNRVDPNLVDAKRNTALHKAAKYGWDEATLLLLFDRRTNSEVRNRDERTPFQVLQAEKEKEGKTPAEIAFLKSAEWAFEEKAAQQRKYQHFVFAWDVLKSLPTPTGLGRLPLDVIRHDIPLLPNLPSVEAAVPSDEASIPSIHLATARKNAAALLRALKREGVDSNFDEHGRVSLLMAIWKDFPRGIEILLGREDIKPNLMESQKTALHVAVERESLEILDLLLNDGRANVNLQNGNGSSPLHLAAANDKVLATRRLLAVAQIAPNLQDIEGKTPLMRAVENGCHEIVDLLLAHSQIDPNLGTYDGKTPLHTAIWEEQGGMVKRLLSHPQTDPNLLTGAHSIFPSMKHLGGIECWVPVSPLDLAFTKPNPFFRGGERLLADGRTDPNVQMANGETVLFSCIGKTPKHKRAFRAILACPRTDPNAVDHRGKAVMHYLKKANLTELVAMLESHPRYREADTVQPARKRRRDKEDQEDASLSS